MIYKWQGGDQKPLIAPNVMLQVTFRNGMKRWGDMRNWKWEHNNDGDDIIAYEIIHPYVSPVAAIAGNDDEATVFRHGSPIFTGVITSPRPDANVDTNTETFGPLKFPNHPVVPKVDAVFDGNGDAGGEGKQTNPKDAIGGRKAKFSVIPAGVLFDLGNAMVEGMVKYGRHNYRHAGVRANVYYDAAVGHLADWWEGQDIDPESGLSHVTKAIASLVVLRDAMLQGMLTDDRPPRSRVFKADFSPMTGEIIDRHRDKSPRHFTIADSREAA